MAKLDCLQRSQFPAVLPQFAGSAGDLRNAPLARLVGDRLFYRVPKGSSALRRRRPTIDETELVSFWIEHRRPSAALEADGCAETPETLDLCTSFDDA